MSTDGFDSEIYFTDPRNLEETPDFQAVDRLADEDELKKCEGSDEKEESIYLTDQRDLEDKLKTNSTDDQVARYELHKYEGSNGVEAGIYFTDPNDLREWLDANTNDDQKNKGEVIPYKSYHLEGSPQLSRKSSIPDEYLLEMPSTKDKQIDTSSEALQPSSDMPDFPSKDDRKSKDDITSYKSYYLEDSPTLSRENSVPDEYLLEIPSKNDGLKDSSSNAPQLRTNKPVVEDIYDEDHYCLARSPGMSPHDNVQSPESARLEEEYTAPEQTKIGSSYCRNKMIITIIICLVVMGAIGVLVALLLLDTIGILHLYETFCIGI